MPAKKGGRGFNSGGIPFLLDSNQEGERRNTGNFFSFYTSRGGNN